MAYTVELVDNNYNHCCFVAGDEWVEGCVGRYSTYDEAIAAANKINETIEKDDRGFKKQYTRIGFID